MCSCVLSHIFLFLKIQKCSWKSMENKENVDYYFLFQNFKNPRKQFESQVQSTRFVANQSVVTLKLFSWRRFPRALIFDRKRENMTSLWLHLRPTDRSLGKFLWSGCVNWWRKGYAKLGGDNSLRFFLAVGRKVEGGVSSPPPPPSGLGLRHWSYPPYLNCLPHLFPTVKEFEKQRLPVFINTYFLMDDS